MKLSEFAIKRPITSVMFFAALVLLGLVSLSQLNLLLLPETQATRAMVRIDPEREIAVEEAEREFLIPIEGIVAQLEGVQEIQSRWGDHRWRRRVDISFHRGVNVYHRVVDLQDRLDNFREQFDRGEVEFRVYVYETSRFNNEPIEIDLTGPVDDPFFQNVNLEDIQAKLTQIEGVSESDTWGGMDKIVEVGINQDELRQYGMSMYQVVNRIRNYANEPMVLGEIYDRGKRHFVRFDGQFDSTNEIDEVVLRDQQNLMLRHVGDAEETFEDRDSVYMSAGRPAVNFDLQKTADVNPIVLSQRVRNNLDRINSELPSGYEFHIKQDQAVGIMSLIKLLSYSALIGILLAMAVLFAFIRNWRMTLVICLVIPVCVIAAFNGLYFASLTLNIVTLIGLSVGVGSLIDNSIVVMENIFRHYERGMSAVKAAIRGSHEVGWAIFALTMTGIIVFLPIVFTEATSSSPRRGMNFLDFFQQGALAIIIPICISMLVALTVVPMTSARLLPLSRWGSASRWKSKDAQNENGAQKPSASRLGFLPKTNWVPGRMRHWMNIRTWQRGYIRMLKTTLRFRFQFLIAIVLLCLYTFFYTWPSVSQDVMSGPRDRNEFDIYVTMDSGTKLDHTVEVCSQLKELIEQEVPEHQNITARVRSDNARVEVELKPPDQRDRNADTIREELRPFLDNFAGADVSLTRNRSDSMSGAVAVPQGRGGSIEIRGPEIKQLQRISQNFSEIIYQIPGILEAYPESEEGPQQYHFSLDRKTCALFQITSQDIADSIRVAQRRNEQVVLQLNREDEEIDIVFIQKPSDPEEAIQEEDDDEEGITETELREIPVYSPAIGSTLPLESLGNLELVSTTGDLFRYNRERLSRIEYVMSNTADFREVEEQINNLISTYPVPPGYRMSIDGAGRDWDRDMQGIAFIIQLGLILLYMGLAAIFESFTMPLVIMLSIPLAVIGVIWFLVLTGTSFDPMMSGLGAIFLMGILPNSAILLVYTAANLRKFHGQNRYRAVMQAAKTRLRPILMTVTTTILGLLPLAISPDSVSIWIGWMGSIDMNWMSFARVVIGGLLSSTILTLFIVPGFYFLVEDVRDWVGKWLRKIFAAPARALRGLLIGDLTPQVGLTPKPAHLMVEAFYLTRVYQPPMTARLRHKALGLFSLSTSPQPQMGFLPDYVNAHSSNGNANSALAPKRALSGVNLRLSPGIYGLLGPNGAGKTTLLRLLAGIDQPTRGTVRICGFDMQKQHHKAQRLVRYLPQFFGLYPGMTGRAYLEYMALLKGIRSGSERKRRIEAILEAVNLQKEAQRPVDTFSAGMQRRLGLAQLLLDEPQIILVDEPTADLDINERIKFRNVLIRLAQNRIVLFSTHNAEDIAQTCDEVIIMREGEVLQQGRVQQFLEQTQNRVWSVYLSAESELPGFKKRFAVSSQRKTSEGLQLRIIADSPPVEGAQPVAPTLEEAFMTLVREQN